MDPDKRLALGRLVSESRAASARTGAGQSHVLCRQPQSPVSRDSEGTPAQERFVPPPEKPRLARNPRSSPARVRASESRLTGESEHAIALGPTAEPLGSVLARDLEFPPTEEDRHTARFFFRCFSFRSGSSTFNFRRGRRGFSNT